jgi:Escherichia/Staphylococcus phage prohead protease
VSGYAARYNVLSKPIPVKGSGKSFRERIAKRAFDSVLNDPNLDVICTFNHNPDAVLGRTTSGTLRLRADENGLAFDCDLPNTQVGRDTYESVQRGDLNGCSFAFELGQRDEEWDEEEIEDEHDLGLRSLVKAARRWAVRTIKSFRKLIDVSIVTAPAYPGTNVDARNLVSAECRSHVEQFTEPQYRSFKLGENGLGVYVDPEALTAQRRRKRMLDAVLD